MIIITKRVKAGLADGTLKTVHIDVRIYITYNILYYVLVHSTRVYIITPGFGLSPLKYSINRRWASEIMTTCIHNILIQYNIIYIYYYSMSKCECACECLYECVCVGVRIRFWNDPRLTPIMCCRNIILIYVYKYTRVPCVCFVILPNW